MLTRLQSWLKLSGSGNRRTVLFSGDLRMNFVVFRPVYEALKDDARIRFYFSSDLKRFDEILSLYQPFGIDKSQIIDPHTARRHPFDLFLTPMKVCLGKKAKIKVKMAHGVSFKGKHCANQFSEFDYVVCPGPFLKRVHEDMEGAKGAGPQLVVLGFPKLDALVNGCFNRERLLKEYKLDPALPVVLYAPTWGEGNSVETMGESIARLMQNEPVNFLIRLHEHDRHWREKLKPLVTGNIHFDDTEDVSPSLFLADLLISDASSVANEFTLLDRPIVFCDVPGLLSRYPLNRYDSGWGRQTGTLARTAEEVRNAVREGLKNPGHLSEIRRQVASELFFEPGRSTQLTVAQIYDWLALAHESSAA